MKSEEFDELFRKEVNGLEGLPQNVSWSKESGWKKLNNQLGDPAGKKAIVPFWPAKNILGSYWLYAAAAVITLMLVSVYSVKSYRAVIEHQPPSDALAQAKEDRQPAAVPDNPNRPALEKSIFFSEKLKELNAAKIKNGDNPLLISDPGLKSQLLIYNNLIYPAQKNNQPLLPSLLAQLPDFQPSGAVLPLVLKGWTAPGIELPDEPAAASEIPLGLAPSVTLAETHTNTPLTVVIGGHATAVDQNFNVGLEGSVMFKLADIKGKREQMIGVGMDTRYQFHSLAENDQPTDNLNVADNDEISNGFSTFVTASYSRNLSGKDKKPFWIGMKTGYLIHDNTNSFDDTTFMLEMIVGGNDSSKFKLSPQVYLTDNLKKVMPGIKLGMTLGKYTAI